LGVVSVFCYHEFVNKVHQIETSTAVSLSVGMGAIAGCVIFGRRVTGWVVWREWRCSNSAFRESRFRTRRGNCSSGAPTCVRSSRISNSVCSAVSWSVHAATM